MQEEELLEILADWNFWGDGADTGIGRAGYVTKIMELLKDTNIVAEVGARRSGKSYIARQALGAFIEKGMTKESTLVIDINDERFQKDEGLLSSVYLAYKKNVNPSSNTIIVIDEPQELKGWERFVRGVSERKEAKFIITGSSSKLLSSELSALLGGRQVALRVWPLSFRESLEFDGIGVGSKLEIAKNHAKISLSLGRYIVRGGFPAVALASSRKNIADLLNSYLDTIVVKDIAIRYGIRDEGKLRTLAKFYLTNISHLITYNSISRFTKLPVKTVERFSNYIEDAFLLFFVKRFSFSVKEQENSPRKVYAVDNGIAMAAGFNAAMGKGALIENAIAIELKRRNREFYYWRETQSGKEVDFVVKTRGSYELVQACETIENPSTLERERGSLRAAMRRFKKRGATLIVYSMPADSIVEGLAKDGIAVKHLWKWLIEGRGQ